MLFRSYKTEQDIREVAKRYQAAGIPLDSIYLVSSSVMDQFVALDALDSIALSGTKQDGWYIDEAKQAMAFGKVYTFGPTFRAEKSFTTRHAAEFWMIEPEMAFCDLNGYMDTAEAMTKYVIRYVLDNCPDEMAFFNQFIDKGLIERLELVANSEFGRISYIDAIEILKKNNKKFQFPVEWGVDIQPRSEERRVGKEC